jgi:hypothetical protein
MLVAEPSSQGTACFCCQETTRGIVLGISVGTLILSPVSGAGESWQSSDIVDCILSFAATQLVNMMTAGGDGEAEMLARVKNDPKVDRTSLPAVKECGNG